MKYTIKLNNKVIKHIEDGNLKAKDLILFCLNNGFACKAGKIEDIALSDLYFEWRKVNSAMIDNVENNLVVHTGEEKIDPLVASMKVIDSEKENLFDVKIDKVNKSIIFITINNRKYFINKYGVLGKYSVLENGKKFYQHQIDFDFNSGHALVDGIFKSLDRRVVYA